MLGRLYRFEKRLCIVGSGTCLILMVAVIIVSVLGRYLFHTDLVPGGFNIIERFLFPVLVFCAIPLTYRDGMFPSVTFFREKLSNTTGRIVRRFCAITEILLYLVIVVYAFRFAWQALLDTRTMQIGSETWLLWPILWLVPAIFLLVLLNAVLDLIGMLHPDSLDQ